MLVQHDGADEVRNSGNGMLTTRREGTPMFQMRWMCAMLMPSQLPPSPFQLIFAMFTDAYRKTTPIDVFASARLSR